MLSSRVASATALFSLALALLGCSAGDGEPETLSTTPAASTSPTELGTSSAQPADAPAKVSRQAESAFIAEVREAIVGTDAAPAGSREPRTAPDMSDDEWLARGYHVCAALPAGTPFEDVVDEGKDVWGLLAPFNTQVLAFVAGRHLCPQ